MKRLFISLLGLLAFAAVQAQTSMHVYVDGHHYIYYTSQTDSIVFMDDQAGAAGAGTRQSPYNVAGALKAGSVLAEGERSDSVYVKGYVCRIDEFVQPGLSSYYLTDKPTTNRFFVYRSKGLANEVFTSADELQLGDTLIVRGVMQRYKGFVELATGGYVYSHNGRTERAKPQTGGDGTLENPFTCLDALNYTKELPADQTSTEGFYIKGKVVSIRETFGTQYGNSTFYISDDGTTTNQFYCYRVLYLENRKFAEGDRQLQVGDEVVIYGKVVNYRGTTPETAANTAYIYSLNGQTTATAGPNDNANDASAVPALGRLEFPKVKGGNTKVLIHTTSDSYAGGINYAVEWDINKKSQRWTAYQMNKGFQGSAGRYTDFLEDPDLSASERLSDTYSYYRGSGFTRGHICPSADRQYSEEANMQTFYYSNMQPQYYNFNAGDNYGSPWCRLEGQIRTWTKQSSTDTLYVVKGGTIENDQLLMTIKNQLRVPMYFFVALLMKSKQGYKAIGFWFPHDNDDHSADALGQYAVNVRTLERQTGIDFFCNLPDDLEEQVETLDATSVKEAWGVQ